MARKAGKAGCPEAIPPLAIEQTYEPQGMAGTAWEKGFLMPELPATQPWELCLYSSSFDLWQGSLAVCCKRRMVLSPKAHNDLKCNSWKPNDYCKAKADWSAEPAAEIVGGSAEFL